jgi:peptidoglycan/LPS O-acetylase OafA/YrhL
VEAARNSQRFAGLDGLRVISCFGIIAMHVQNNGRFTYEGFFFWRFIPALTELVYLFMMISGFSLCCGYHERFRTGNISLDTFYKKRYSKILPFFALLIAIDLLVEQSTHCIYQGLMELTLVFGLLPNNDLSVIGVSWTLGVIFLFYMLFPFFVFLTYGRKRAWLSFAASLVIHYLCKIYFFTESFVGWDFSGRRSFLYCAPFFLLGGLIYLYREEICAFVRRWRVGALAAAIAVTAAWFIVPEYIEDYSIETEKTMLVCAVWLCYAMGAGSRLLESKPMLFLSSISLEMYLGHMAVFRVLSRIGLVDLVGREAFGFAVTCAATVVVLVAGILVYKQLVKLVMKVLSGRKTPDEVKV